jgi:hypothetical protein
MHRKLLGAISVDFDAARQLLIVYTAFVEYLRKNLEYPEAVYQLILDFKQSYESVCKGLL